MDAGKTIRKALMTAKSIAKQVGVDARPGFAQGGDTGIEAIKSGRSSAPEDPSGDVREFVKSMYERYPRNPLNNGEFVMPLAENGGWDRFAGFQLSRSNQRPGHAHVSFMYAHPQKEGVGKIAMARLQEHAKEAGVGLDLEAWQNGRTPVTKLRKFYRDTGFTQLGKSKMSNNFAWRPDGRPAKAHGGKAEERAAARREPKTPHHRATTVVKEKGGQWLGGLDDPRHELDKLKMWPMNFGKMKVKPVPDPYVDRKGVKYSHGVYEGNNLLSGAFPGEEAAHAERIRLSQAPNNDGPVARNFQNIKERAMNDLPRHGAVNRFIDSQLLKYVKNEMGTPGDPVRALAERGILHVHPDQLAQPARETPASDPAHVGKVGKSEHAKAWEYATDPQIKTGLAKHLSEPIFNGFENVENPYARINPWLKKLDPETPVHSLDDQFHFGQNHGFDHLTDELHNSIDPESGLPHHLQLRPESLARMGVPQAVEHVHNINEWRRENAAQANFLKAKNPATHLYKDYPDTDYAWHELKMRDAPDFGPDAPLGVRAHEAEARKKELEEALKYEGDTMGHCVGGYSNSVASGKTRILSLRNKKTGEPHATVELNREDPNYDDFKKTLSPEELPVAEAARNFSIQPDEAAKEKHRELEQRFQAFRDSSPPKWSINQIKGKGNTALADRYKPFAQDLVRGGQWANVNDAKNAGLLDVKKKDPYLHGLMTERGDQPPDYMTESEYSAAKDKHIPEVTKEEGDHLFGVNPQFASGGSVDGGPTFDPESGLGATPNNANVDYLGMVRHMSADDFLKTARSLEGNQRTKSVDHIKEHMKSGKPIANPFIEAEWNEGSKQFDAKGHEGRHRALAIKQLYGGHTQIPVHIFPRGGMRARHLTDEMKSAPIVSEDSVRARSNPIDTENLLKQTDDLLDRLRRARRRRADGGSVNHEPTEGQKEAGNYRKEHRMFHGLDISIENKKGSVRSGKDANGAKWRCVLPADYGYIKRTMGADGDHVDCYIGPHADSTHAFIINQRDAKTSKFDEHKVMLGYRSEAEAVRDYVKAFSDGKGSLRMGGCQSVSIDAFKAWLKRGNTKTEAAHDDIVERALKLTRK